MSSGSTSQRVYVSSDGTPWRAFGGMFNTAVSRCPFPPRADQMPYTPYSMRHTYATFALAEGRSYEWLEEVIGTSMGMLKEHYKSGTIEQTRRYLQSKGRLLGTDRGELELIDASALPAADYRLQTLALGPAVGATRN